jgi:hypothetical protein
MYAELTRFLDAVERMSDLWRRGLLRFDVSPQGGVSIDFDDAAATEQPQPGGGLYNDLEDAMNAVAVDVPLEAFVNARSQPRLNFPEPEPAADAEQKYDAVRRLLTAAHVQERTLLSATSKIPVLVRHDWEVVHREAESVRRPAAQEARYGILRFTAEDSHSARLEPGRDVLVAAVDADRLRVLLDDLGRFYEALSEPPSAGESSSAAGADEPSSTAHSGES